MAKVTRKGSGRTKGSFSFVKVTLAELQAKFADPQQPIVIGRKWAEEVGFTNLTASPANQTMDSIQGQTPKSAVTATVNLLED